VLVVVFNTEVQAYRANRTGHIWSPKGSFGRWTESSSDDTLSRSWPIASVIDPLIRPPYRTGQSNRTSAKPPSVHMGPPDYVVRSNGKEGLSLKILIVSLESLLEDF